MRALSLLFVSLSLLTDCPKSAPKPLSDGEPYAVQPERQPHQ